VFRKYIWGNIIETIKTMCEVADTLGYRERITAEEEFKTLMGCKISDGKGDVSARPVA
jgi:hypothetical protein